MLRSTHLPGLRRFELLPHYPHLCCPYPAGDPRNENIEAHRAEDFRVDGWTAGPRYAAEEMTLPVLTDLLAHACTLAWIPSPGVCHSLQVKLDSGQVALQAGDSQRAREHLRAFLNELEAQHGPQPGKHVTDNAYWLLKVNAEYMLGRL